MSYANLKVLLAKADKYDTEDGIGAYRSYHQVILAFSDHYGIAFDRTLAAFVALSPNNDYFGNLRSLASVLAGYRDGRPLDQIVISTYNHCRNRAYGYATGEIDFLGTVKGPKIRSFYMNILNPDDPKPVTVDGHIACAYRGINAPMKQAIVRSRAEYELIAGSVRRLARRSGLLPNQLQAVLWLTRKRILKIKFEGQLDLFNGAGASSIKITPATALPYRPSAR